MTAEEEPPAVRRRVALRAPDPSWPERFAQEQAVLRAALTALGPLRIEHIGSTAIPGIWAKPIIDIMVGVVTYDPFEEYRERFASLGYVYDANALRDEPGRHVFRKGPPQLRTHHLHFTHLGSPYWLRILAFRDYLRTNPEVAREYEELKTELAARYAGDGRRYTKAKGAFVRRVQETALSL